MSAGGDSTPSRPIDAKGRVRRAVGLAPRGDERLAAVDSDQQLAPGIARQCANASGRAADVNGPVRCESRVDRTGRGERAQEHLVAGPTRDDDLASRPVHDDAADTACTVERRDRPKSRDNLTLVAERRVREYERVAHAGGERRGDLAPVGIPRVAGIAARGGENPRAVLGPLGLASPACEENVPRNSTSVNVSNLITALPETDALSPKLTPVPDVSTAAKDRAEPTFTLMTTGEPSGSVDERMTNVST
jgi:hypothetical protein